MMYDCPCLHRSLVDEHSVEIFGGFSGSVGPSEDDVGNTAALAILVVL
jgi:hypothetical protein